MKNLKKLFITLPLVLVMFFTTVPVAANDAYKVEANSLGLKLKLDYTVDEKEFKAETRMVPIWGAVKTSQGVDSFNIINEGFPIKWVQANTLEDTDSLIGKSAVEILPVFADYELSTHEIQRVAPVRANVKVLQSWTEKGLDEAYYVAFDQHIAIEAGEEYRSGAYFVDQDAENEDSKAPHYGNPGVSLFAAAGGTPHPFSTIGFKLPPSAKDGDTFEFLYKNQKTTYKVTIDSEPDEIGYIYKKVIFQDNLYQYPEGYDITSEVRTIRTCEETKQTIVTVKQGAYVGEGLDVVVTVAEAEDKLVNETIEGLVLILEETENKTDLELVKEAKRAEIDKEDLTEEEKADKTAESITAAEAKLQELKNSAKAAVNAAATVEDVNAVIVNKAAATALLEEVTAPESPAEVDDEEVVSGEGEGEEQVDPQEPETPVDEDAKQEVNGTDAEVTKLKFVENLNHNTDDLDNTYEVDSVSTKNEINEKFVDTTPAVASANVSRLPATGSASNFALILSSAALLLVGLFLKK